MKTLGEETKLTKKEARELVHSFNLRLPRAGHLVRVVRPIFEHQLGLYDFAVFQRQGQWLKVNVTD